MKKILLIRFSSLGDVILISPVIKILAENNFKVYIYTKENYASVFKNNPYVEEVLVLKKGDSVFNIVKKIRSNGFYRIIDLHKNLRTFIVKIFFPFKSITYKKYRFRRWLLIRFKINLLKNNSVILNYFSAIKKLNIKYSNLEEGYKIYYNKITDKKIQEILKEKPVVLAPFSKWFTKEWPYFKELIKKLEGKIVILGSKNEYKRAESLATGMDNVYNLCGRLDIAEIGYVFEKGSVFVSNDSGLLHYAAGTDIPVVAIFGSTSRELGFYPVRKNIIILENKNINCRPCHHHGRKKCPKKHFKCMRDISVESVLKHIDLIKTNSKF